MATGVFTFPLCYAVVMGRGPTRKEGVPAEGTEQRESWEWSEPGRQQHWNETRHPDPDSKTAGTAF